MDYLDIDLSKYGQPNGMVASPRHHVIEHARISVDSQNINIPPPKGRRVSLQSVMAVTAQIIQSAKERKTDGCHEDQLWTVHRKIPFQVEK